MANQDEKRITILHEGKAYSGTYWIRGGTVTVSSGLGPDETVDVGVYDKPADEVAEIVLRKNIDEYVLNSPGT
jgi:hypothetical protein